MEPQHRDYWLRPQNQHYQGGEVIEYSAEISATPSLTGSPILSDFDPVTSTHHLYQSSYGHLAVEDVKFPYQVPVTPSYFSSEDDGAYCSPQAQLVELSYPPMSSPSLVSTGQPDRPAGKGRTQATSGRRRAQNRAAQRAFRERKEKHARDLETALSALTERYQYLETSHAELSAVHEKLRETIERLTKEANGADASHYSRETLQRLLEMTYGENDSRTAEPRGRPGRL